MSWFDTAGFASLAKSALKEAQKTIDKALDINEDDPNSKGGENVAGEVSEREGGGEVSRSKSGEKHEEGFFTTWGLSGIQPDSPTKSINRKMTSSTSLWGSFTGSFFDNPASSDTSPQGESGTPETSNKGFVLDQPKKSSTMPLRSMSLDLVVNTSPSPNQPDDTPSPCPQDDDGTSIREEIKNYPPVEVVFRRRDPASASVRNSNNRLSVISSESDRRSTDSCDVLGSTPDSDPASISTSSLHQVNRQSGESFESSVDLVTSPSSIEVIATDSSPLSPSKFSSDSVSPISESLGCDEEEISDSYTSLSETATTATVLQDLPQQPLMLRSTSSIDTSFSDTLSPRDSLTRAGTLKVTSGIGHEDSTVHHHSKTELEETIQTRHGVGSSAVPGTHSTPAPCVTVQVPSSSLVSTSAQSGAQIEPEEVKIQDRLSAVPSDQSLSRLSAGSESSGYIVESSSCEETLMGSSGEAGREVGDSSSDMGDNTDHGKEAMLAEAMADTASSHREHSPISSDRSDLVKIGSSGHTSGDELETATSSDIEIISSPATNGDSSSTASRQSPSKTACYRAPVGSLSRVVTSKVKGHNRQPSEASSGGSEEGSEVDRLLKRISDMTEILEARESKLIDLSRLNASLQESNSDLKSQLESQQESEDAGRVREEFTQRLTALERKFQQAIRDKEQLKKQLDQAKRKAAEKEEEMDKDQLIAELRSEGEKLSKQQLLLNNTIKKLRAAEKDNTKTITTLKEQVSSLTQDLERSKKAMSAKEDMERSHIEAVHNLTKQKNQLEKEVEKFKQDISSLTSSLVSVQKELTEKENSYKELETKRDNERRALEKRVRDESSVEMEAMERQVTSLQGALENMQAQLVSAQQTHSKSEGALRREAKELINRLENAERRCEEATQALGQATKPLTKQIWDLTQAQQAQAQAFSNTEHHLNTTISDLENKCLSLSASERSVREQYEEASSQLASVQSRLHDISNENQQLSKRLAQAELRIQTLDSEKIHLTSDYEGQLKKLKIEYEETRRELKASQEILSVTKAALEAEKRKQSHQLIQQSQSPAMFQSAPPALLHIQDESGDEVMNQSQGGVSTVLIQTDDSASSRSSPTLAVGHHRRTLSSLSDSLHSALWPNYVEEGSLFDSMSSSGRVYDVLRPSNNTTFLETLQSQLKLREGELVQLQTEVVRLEAERASLSSEVVEMSASLRLAESQLAEHSQLKTSYDALLQMYGEKLEQYQELQLDLDDVKHMYKQQIEELLQKKDVKPPPQS